MRNGAPLALLDDRRGSRDVASYRTMAQIKNANTDADGVFFRPDMMQVFDTHLEGGPVRGRFFITSERFISMRGKSYARRFTLREAMPDGSIATVGEFQQHATKADALRAAQEAP